MLNACRHQLEGDPIAIRNEFRRLGFVADVGNDKLLYVEVPLAAFVALTRNYIRQS